MAALSRGGALCVLMCSLPIINPDKNLAQRDLVPAHTEVLDFAAIHRQL